MHSQTEGLTKGLFCLKTLPGLLILVCVISRAAGAPALMPDSNMGKGVNYETGNGMNQLNCDGGNVKQIRADMEELTALHLQWVRV